jgi:hypothetical protein
MFDVPTEDQEQTMFVQYLDLRGLKYFRVPNETFTKSWSQRAKNKRLGVKPGVPDIFVIAAGRLIAIEMKRRAGSRTTPEQLEWLKELVVAGVPSAVCKGVDEAIQFVEAIEAELEPKGSDMWDEKAAA